MSALNDLIRSFMESYHALKPKDRNFFMQNFLDEIKKSKKNDEGNFIDAFLKEVKDTASPKNEEDNNFIERFLEEVKNHIPIGNNSKEVEINKNKTFVLPIGFNYFNKMLNEKIEFLYQKNKQELIDLGYITREKIGENEVSVFNRDNLFSQEQIQKFKKEYAKSYFDALLKKYPHPEELRIADINQEGGLIIECLGNKQNFDQESFLNFVKDNPVSTSQLNLQWTNEINIKNIKSLKANQEFLKHDSDFLEIFEKEYKAIDANNTNKHKQEKIQIPSNNKSESHKPQYTSLPDWFEKIKIEHKNFNISKDEFKKRFIQYCQNNMSENEMKILLIMANKTPSLLTPEHRKMIHNGLEASNTNSNLIDKGLQCCIKAQIGETLNQEDRNLMKNFLKSKCDSLDPIDRKLYENFASSKNQNIINNLKEENVQNKNKTQGIKK